jgi:hypothetical protein
MAHIIAFTGKKQSGKNTQANYLAGEILLTKQVIDKYEVNASGELLVPTILIGLEEPIMMPIDLARRDEAFLRDAPALIWPHVKLFSFADPLKDICMNLFDLTYDQCYGSNEAKETLTGVKWENLPHYIRLKNAQKDKCPKGFMTAREIMQHVGTEIVRRTYENAWANNCIRRILADKPGVAMICDCRFPNEVEVVRQAGGKVIRLARDVSNDKHVSETALDPKKYDWNNFDLVVPAEATMEEAAKLCKEKFVEWGVLA